MSATGLDVFDKTLQITHTWLDELMTVIGPDRKVAWHVLGAVLRRLRDRVPTELAVALGAQLPLLVRGLYYDQWHMAEAPDKTRHLDDFLDSLDEALENTRPVDSEEALRAVFGILSRHVDPGMVAKFRHALPGEIQALWPDDAGRFVAETRAS